MAGTDEHFLRRWSRLRQGNRPSKEQPVAEPTGESASPESTKASPEAGGAGGTPAELPDIESLDKDSDFTVFLKDGVPENLRGQALRKLWCSDPVFAFRDGLDDYDDDYTKLFPKLVSKVVKTLAKAGKDVVTPGEEGAGPETAEGDEAVADDDEAAEGEDMAGEADAPEKPA